MTSIRDLREQYRQEAGQLRIEKLILELSVLLKSQPLDKTADPLLTLLAAGIGASHAALLRYHNGRLQAMGGIGSAPPSQVRLPASGLLPTLLKHPARTLLREQITDPWVFFQRQLSYELLIPLTYGAQVTGILAFAANDGPAPQKEQVALLEGLSVFIAGLWPEANAGRRRLSDRQQQDLNSLSPREREVMGLLPRGMSNQRIADVLGIKAGTVKTHVEHILSKLQLDDRAQAAARAVELRLGSSE